MKQDDRAGPHAGQHVLRHGRGRQPDRRIARRHVPLNRQEALRGHFRQRLGAAGAEGGHAFFLPPANFATERDQTQMLARLARERVPVVLINETQRPEFAVAFPRIDAHLTSAYRPLVTFALDSGEEVTLALARDLTARRAWGDGGWPCGFESPPSVG
jgi:hypothetical protein